MTDDRRQNGFTLAEILVAMVVASIILAAVVTMAYAIGAIKDASDDTAYKQAQLRYATLSISELIRNCKLVFGQTTEGLAIWRADDNGNGQIDVNEVVFLSRCPGGDCLRFIEFSSVSLPVFSDPNAILPYLFSGTVNPTYTNLIPTCSNVQFVIDVSPPWTRSVTVLFDLQENGFVHHYQINATLRAWAGHLLNQAGILVPTYDDEQ